MSLKLSLTGIADRYAREALAAVQTYLNTEVKPAGFKFFEIEFEGAVSERKHPHGLGFVPKDIIQTSLTGAGSLTWVYTKFDRENVYITTTGACTVRCYIGSHQEDA